MIIMSIISHHYGTINKTEVTIVAKSKTNTYILTLKLDTEKFQEDIIDKRLDFVK